MATLRLYTNTSTAAHLGEECVHLVYLIVDGPQNGFMVHSDLSGWCHIQRGHHLCAQSAYLAIHQMMLPTYELKELDHLFIDDWLPVVQGPALCSTEPNNDQHTLILQIMLTYCAFIKGHEGVNLVNYSTFVGLLVHGTLNVKPDNDAAFELAEVDKWIQEVIPVIRASLMLMDDVLMYLYSLSGMQLTSLPTMKTHSAAHPWRSALPWDLFRLSLTLEVWRFGG